MLRTILEILYYAGSLFFFLAVMFYIIDRKREPSLWVLALASAFFFQQTIDSVLQLASAFLIGKDRNPFVGFTILANQDGAFLKFVLVSIIAKALLLSMISSLFKNLSALVKASRYLLSVIMAFFGSVVFILMQFLFSDRPHQYSVMMLLSWFLILICVLSIMVAFLRTARLQQEQAQRMVQESSGRILESSYRAISRQQDLLSGQIHDHRNQLRSLLPLSPEDMKAQILSLLDESLPQLVPVHTGDPYIDAIVSVKLAEATQQETALLYHISLPSRLPFSAADICTIVSNLLDNALEACQKIPQVQDRRVIFTIDQKGYFYSITVENPIVPGSIQPGTDLFSTKENPKLHGFGLKNVRAAAEKNAGSLAVMIEPERFIARVILEAKD